MLETPEGVRIDRINQDDFHDAMPLFSIESCSSSGLTHRHDARKAASEIPFLRYFLFLKTSVPRGKDFYPCRPATSGQGMAFFPEKVLAADAQRVCGPGRRASLPPAWNVL